MQHPTFRAPRLAAFSLALSLALIGSACGSSDDTVTGAGNGADDDDNGGGSRDAGRDAKADARADSKSDSGLPPIKENDGIEKCAGIRSDAPAGTGAVDVIFIIDTSGSMLPVITQVRANIERFIRDFEGSTADTRVTLITGDNLAAGTSVENDADRYRFIQSEVDSKALYSVALALFPAYQDFLRPNGVTQFVMITDDEDAIPADVFSQQMNGLLGHPFTQHAIASEDRMGAPCLLPGAAANPLCAGAIPFVCTAASIGRNYYQLADDTAGEKISICSEDFTQVFDRLRSAVIASVPLPCEYPLAQANAEDFNADEVSILYTPQGEDDQEFPKASSASQCGEKVGWYYDNPDKPSTISLCPKACQQVAAGGTLDIAFGCPPMVYL